MSLRSLWNGALARRHGGVVIFIALFLAVAAATRVALLVKAADVTTFNPALAGAFALEFALFAFHLEGTALDVRAHKILVVTIGCCATLAFAEAPAAVPVPVRWRTASRARR